MISLSGARGGRRHEGRLLDALAQAVWDVLADDRRTAVIRSQLAGSPAAVVPATTLCHPAERSVRTGSPVSAAGSLDEHWVRSVRGSSGGGPFLFTGRDRILADVARFASRREPGLCVVTGMPGAGKSAVLSGLVVRSLAAQILPADLCDRLPDSRVDVAVHARDRNAGELAAELGATWSLDPTALGAQAAVTAYLEDRESGPLIVVDAVDEAAAADDVLAFVFDLSALARVIIGVRPSGAQAGDGPAPIPPLLRALHPLVVDLDAEMYKTEDDVAEYVARRLAADPRESGYGPNGGWTDELLVAVIGREVARTAGKNFLVAQFMIEELLIRAPLRDFSGRWSDALAWPTRVEDWMARDLRRRLPGTDARLAELLRPLAFAERGGLPVGIWQEAAGLFRREPVALTELDEVVRRLGFFVASSGGADTRYSLRHEAFNAYFRSGPFQQEYASLLFTAVLAAVPVDGAHRRWDSAPPYVRENVLTHARAAARLDAVVVEESQCLAAVDLEAAGVPLAAAGSVEARQASATFRRASYAAAGSFSDRTAALAFHASLAGYRWMSDALATHTGRSGWRTEWRAGGIAAGVPVGTPTSTWSVMAVRASDGWPALVTSDVNGTVSVTEASTQMLLGPRLRLPDRAEPPTTTTAWNGSSGDVYVATGSESGRVRIWLATGTRADTSPIATFGLEPPIRHVVPVSGPAGTDLLWIASGDPTRVTVWPVGARDTSTEPLFDMRPTVEADAVRPVGRGTVSSGVLTAASSGELGLWTFPPNREPEVVTVLAAAPVRGLSTAGSVDRFCVVVDRREVLDVKWWDERRIDQVAESVSEGGPLSRYTLGGDGTGCHLAVARDDGRIVVWQLRPGNGPQVRTRFDFGSPVRALEFLDDAGLLVAVAGWSGPARVFACDTPSARPVASLDHGEPIADLVPLGLTDSGAMVVTRSPGGLTKRWQVVDTAADETGRVDLDPDTVGVTQVVTTLIGDDTDVVVTATAERGDVTIRLIGPGPLPAAPDRTVLQHGEGVYALAAATRSAGSMAVCAVGDEHLSAWLLDDRAGAAAHWHLPTDEEPVELVALLAEDRDRALVVTAGPEALRITPLDAGTDTLGSMSTLADTPVTALTVHRAGDHDVVLAGTDDGDLHIIRIGRDASIEQVRVEHGEAIRHVVPLPLPAGRPTAATIGRSGTVRVWDLVDTGRTPCREFRHITEITLAGSVRSNATSMLAVVDLTDSLKLIDVNTETPRAAHHVPSPGGRPSQLVVDSGPGDTAALAIAYSTGRVLVVDTNAASSTVVDLNCDLTGLSHLRRRGWWVGAYGAALVGFAMRRT